jgi:hypothetical protein
MPSYWYTDSYLHHSLFYTYGALNVWMIAFSIMLFNWYPNLIKSNYWWVQQCPKTSWTSALVSSSIDVATTGTSSVIAVDLNGWTLDLCLKAAPVKQWNNTAWTYIVTSSLTFVLWAANLLMGLQGGVLDWFWWKST